MSADSALIDRIVHGVLTQLAAGDARATSGPQATMTAKSSSASSSPQPPAQIGDRIITAELLVERVGEAREISVKPKAIITPAAQDLIRERGLTVRRIDAATVTQSPAARQSPAGKPILLVVRSTASVDRVYEDLKSTWRRELLGCPDDAAQLAISAIARGESSTVVILTAQTHLAACLANRNDAVKAVAVADAGDVAAVRKQLRANVWCIDPGNRSWFELKKLFGVIEK